MGMNRGILYLQNPLNQSCKDTILSLNQGLVFTENEPLLYQAQAALQHARRKWDWLCVCAQGHAACLALALAAQLPVDRLALIAPEWGAGGMRRELLRLRSYARRNLALITAEILLLDAPEDLVRSLMRGNRHSRLCLLESFSEERLILPWEALAENNLLIRGKCV